MNNFSYDEISIGDMQQFAVTVTEDMFLYFNNLSGDTNPLHTDEKYAQNKGHKGKVAYGMLTAAFYSTLCGVYLPGEHSLIHGIELKFNKPVYTNDTLDIVGTVEKKYDKFNLLKLSATITRREDGMIVSSAVIQVGVTSKKVQTD